MKKTCGNCGWGFNRVIKDCVWCDWLDQVALPKLKMKFGDLPESVDKIMMPADEEIKCKCWTPRREAVK
jgi:hypothetical protein